MFRKLVILAIIVLLCVFVPTTLRQGDESQASVTVYCAHDSVFSAEILERFEQQFGIRVDVRFDEEASKSLGLTNQLIAEKNNPRCDVFWNNQTLGTVRLQREGILAPYVSPNADRIPAKFKDARGYWTGFAARLRVHIINVRTTDVRQEAIDAIWSGENLQRTAIAVPLFGTTLSHFSLLAAHTSLEHVQQWYTSLRSKGTQVVRGNSVTRDLVSEGVCDVALTDTDDAFSAIDKGRAVDLLPVRLPSGETLCLPNSVAIIKGARHPDEARRLVDFLLSEEVETLMAQSSSRQIPLGPVDESKLPADVRRLIPWAREGADLISAAEMHDRVLQWLSEIHVKP